MTQQGYAGFWIRFLALLVDVVILATMFAVLFAAGILFGSSLGAMAFMVMGVLYAVGPLVYTVGMQASERQGTYGKALLGLKVSTTDGERLSVLRSLGRELAKILSAIPLLLGYVVAAFTTRKQAVHDLVASTEVVRHDTARVGAALAVVLVGWLAPVGITVAVGLGPVLTGLSALQTALAGGAQEQTAQRESSREQPAAPASARGPSQEARSSDAGQRATPVAGLPGMEGKPGTMRAGPALLELDATFTENVWITVYLPPTAEFQGAKPVVRVTHVTDSKGAELYDPGHNLESEFFQRVSMTSWDSPVPHLKGTRSVSLKTGANGRDAQRIEGVVKLGVPAQEFPFVLTKSSVAGAVATRGGAAEPTRPLEPAKPPSVAAAAAVAADEKVVVLASRAETRPARIRAPRQDTVTELAPEAAAALEQLSPRFAHEAALIQGWFRDRPVLYYDFGIVPQGASPARVLWPIHGFDARGNPVAIRGQRPIFTTIPGLGNYSGLWQLTYVVTADMAQPNAMRDLAAVNAAVRARKAVLRDANVSLNLPIVPRGTTLAGDTTRGMPGWYEGRDVQFFDFGAASVTPVAMLRFAVDTNAAGEPILLAGQHAILDSIPVAPSYPDVRDIRYVRVDAAYAVNSLKSAAAVRNAGLMVDSTASTVRNLPIARVDGVATVRAPSPLRAFADLRSGVSARPTPSP